MKLKIKILLARFKQSKFLLGIVCLVIGATSTFNFIEGKELYDYIQGGLKYTKRIVINGEPKLVSDVSQDMGESVKTGSYLDSDSEKGKSPEAIITDYFGDNAVIALAVAKAESGLQHDAINKNSNGTLDVGIFQINDCHELSVEDRLDVEKNIKFAYELYQKQGWTPWVAYNNNSFKKYL